MSKSLSKCALIPVAILSVTLAGCVTTTGSKGPTSTGAAPFCRVAEPIYWSAKDTDKTIAQVREHNAVGKKLCKWGR
jgi:hypothetical protein